LKATVTADGREWFTFGGREFYTPTGSNPPANHSKVVSFDPTTAKFDGYIYTVESYGDDGSAYGDRFDPADIGDGCPGTSTEQYALASSVALLRWPTPTRHRPPTTGASQWTAPPARWH
jgi:hypothetical protein